MLSAAECNGLLGVDDSYKAPEKLMKILYDRPKREQLMRDVLSASDYKVDDDFFREYFENEHADRRNKKQDFTPPSISKLVSRLIGPVDGLFYEPCAGTGSMTITQWDHDRKQHSPFDYRPSWYFYTVEELSDRTIPFLIFNLALRGMNALIVHCDVLSRKAYGAFFIQNDKDDHLMFSSINRLPYTKGIEEALAVKFVEQKYEEIIESPSDWNELPALSSPTGKGHVSDFTKAVYSLFGIGTFEKTTEIEREPYQLTLF